MAQNEAAAAKSRAKAKITSVGAMPGGITPPAIPAIRTTRVVTRLRACAASMGPSTRARRGAGLDWSRSKNPPSRSRASVIPELIPANPAPMTAAMGMVNARYDSPANCGRAPMPWNAPAVAMRMNSGITREGMNTDGTRRTSSRLRPARPRLTLMTLTRPPSACAGGRGPMPRW